MKTELWNVLPQGETMVTTLESFTRDYTTSHHGGAKVHRLLLARIAKQNLPVQACYDSGYLLPEDNGEIELLHIPGCAPPPSYMRGTDEGTMLPYHACGHLQQLLASQLNPLGVSLNPDQVALLIVRRDPDRNFVLFLDAVDCQHQ